MTTWEPSPTGTAQPEPAEPEPQPEAEPAGAVADAWWASPRPGTDDPTLDLDDGSGPEILPSMAELDELSAELDEIDAALARMDADGPLGR